MIGNFEELINKTEIEWMKFFNYLNLEPAAKHFIEKLSTKAAIETEFMIAKYLRYKDTVNISTTYKHRHGDVNCEAYLIFI